MENLVPPPPPFLNCHKNEEGKKTEEAKYEKREGIESEETALIELHKHKQFYLPTAELLNTHWKMKVETRIQIFERSNQNFPLHLILITKEEPSKLIGHAVLKRTIEREKEACLVESVIVDSKYRGMSYGRVLMEGVEKYAKEEGKFDWIYLSTRDRQAFYKALGFSSQNCESVSPLSPLSNLSSFLKKNEKKKENQQQSDLIWMKKFIG